MWFMQYEANVSNLPGSGHGDLEWVFATALLSLKGSNGREGDDPRRG